MLSIIEPIETILFIIFYTSTNFHLKIDIFFNVSEKKKIEKKNTDSILEFQTCII